MNASARGQGGGNDEDRGWGLELSAITTSLRTPPQYHLSALQHERDNRMGLRPPADSRRAPPQSTLSSPLIRSPTLPANRCGVAPTLSGESATRARPRTDQARAAREKAYRGYQEVGQEWADGGV